MANVRFKHGDLVERGAMAEPYDTTRVPIPGDGPTHCERCGNQLFLRRLDRHLCSRCDAEATRRQWHQDRAGAR
jgi:hypothetical protein